MAKDIKNSISEEEMKKAGKALKGKEKEAKKLLKDKEKIDKLLKDAEKKIKDIGDVEVNLPLPDAANKKLEASIKFISDGLSYIPLFIDVVYNYVNGYYKEIPVASIVTIVAAIIYFVSPVDLVPDVIPVAGYFDDAAVVAVCITAVKKDLDSFKEWRG